MDARGEYTPCPPSSRACAPLTDAGWNTTGDVCSGTFAHLARARARWKRGKPLLPWKVCLCFLGWSASSHELENARYRRVMRTGSETSERCTDTASSRYGGANGRQRLVCSPRNVRCNARYAVLPLSASQEACLRRRCRRDLFPFPASPLLSHLDDEVATR